MLRLSIQNETECIPFPAQVVDRSERRHASFLSKKHGSKRVATHLPYLPTRVVVHPFPRWQTHPTSLLALQLRLPCTWWRNERDIHPPPRRRPRGRRTSRPDRHTLPFLPRNGGCICSAWGTGTGTSHPDGRGWVGLRLGRRRSLRRIHITIRRGSKCKARRKEGRRRSVERGSRGGGTKGRKERETRGTDG